MFKRMLFGCISFVIVGLNVHAADKESHKRKSEATHHHECEKKSKAESVAVGHLDNNQMCTLYRKLIGHHKPIVTLLFNAAGTVLISESTLVKRPQGSQSNSVINYWNVATGGLLQKEYISSGIVLSEMPVLQIPGTKTYVYGNEVGNICLMTDEGNKEFPAHVDEITALTVSPDGRFVASGGENGVIKLWCVNTSIQ